MCEYNHSFITYACVCKVTRALENVASLYLAHASTIHVHISFIFRRKKYSAECYLDVAFHRYDICTRYKDVYWIELLQGYPVLSAPWWSWSSSNPCTFSICLTLDLIPSFSAAPKFGCCCYCCGFHHSCWAFSSGHFQRRGSNSWNKQEEKAHPHYHCHFFAARNKTSLNVLFFHAISHWLTLALC